MSYELVDAVLKRSPARGIDRAVLIALASYAANGTGECYPSISHIAERAGWSRVATLAALDRLVAQGLVTRVRRSRRRGNRYRIPQPGAAR